MYKDSNEVERVRYLLTRLLLAVLGTWGLAAAGGAVSLAAPPPEKQFAAEVRRAESLGRKIYEQDAISARATDVLMGAVDIKAMSGLRGWITVRRHGHWLVRFVEDCADGFCAVYDVELSSTLDDAKTGVVYVNPPEPLRKRELAMFRARQTAIAANPFTCSVSFNSVVLPAESGSEWLVYILSATTEAGVLPVGGHFVARVSEDGSSLLELRKLANSCLQVGATPAGDEPKAVAFFVTHVVSPLPIETHVFLSLVQPLPLYVITDSGIWSVGDGRIRYVQPTPTAKPLGPNEAG